MPLLLVLPAADAGRHPQNQPDKLAVQGDYAFGFMAHSLQKTSPHAIQKCYPKCPL